MELIAHLGAASSRRAHQFSTPWWFGSPCPMLGGVNGRERELRERWFTEGAAALFRTLAAIGQTDLLPSAGEFYVCPLCLGAYTRRALDGSEPRLTLEDVPPKKVGGRPLVLTCRGCNNTHGSAIDAHASRREEAHDLLVGRDPGRDVRAEFTVGDIALQVRLDVVSDAFRLTVVEQANNPKEVAAAVSMLEASAAGAADGPIGFRLTDRILLVRAQLSWVRAAYLVAFASFGWRYVLLLSSLNLLREQLADPDADLLPPLALLDLDASPERRELLIVREPAELRSLAVVVGRYTVFVPWLEEPQSFEDLAGALGRLPGAPPRVHFSGKKVPWPTEPRYAFDE
jgi:hypothetical protein